MKKDIELCGIGNALVDIQIEVDDSIISKFNLVKGGMQLADEHKQSEMINFLSDKRHNKSSGGSAANTIIAFAQLGGKTAYQTVIGNDKLGNFYSKEFTDLGIKLSAKKETQNPTGTCLILITPDSQRTMITSLGASANYTIDDVDEEIIKRSKWLYIEGYEFTQEQSTNAIFYATEIAMQNDTKIALTFSDGFIIDFFYDKLKAIADLSDLVFCNESEALKLSKLENLSETIVYFNENIKNFAITKGKDGSLIKWDNEFYEIPPYSATPKDSTGAGDMFAGAFLYGLINTNSAFISGHLASISAAKVVSKLGARLKKEELIVLKNKILNNFKE